MTASESLLTQSGNNAYATNVASSASKFDVNDIVMHFGREYYTMLSCEPERLHCFYSKQSSLLHCQEEETDATVCVGLDEIHQRLVSMGYNGARVVIANIDCQPSMNGGILIFVIGTMHWPLGMVRKFAQTFLLAEQPNGYFVLNDIMRILGENPTVPVPVKVVEKAAPVKAAQPAVATVEKVVPVASKVKPEPTVVAPAPTASPVKKPVEKVVTVAETATPATPVTPTATPTASAVVVEKEKEKKTAEKKKAPETPAKKKDQEEKLAAAPTTPSSWAKLAAVQTNLWQSGVVAESKGTVASISVEGPSPTTNANVNNCNTSRVNYRTNGERQERRRSDTRREDNNESSNVESSAPRTTNATTTGTKTGNYVRRDNNDFDASKSVYVSNVTLPVTREEARKAFESFGRINSFDLVPSKGIAFIEFETVEAQKAAIASPVSFNSVTVSIEARRAVRPTGATNGSATRRPYHNNNNNNNNKSPRE